MRKICTYTILMTVLWLFLAGTVLRQQRLASNLIRIHILANSDSAEDQAEKLRVRDTVLQEITRLTADCRNRRDAAAVLIGHAEAIAKTASETAGRNASVSLTPEWYETRHYNGFSLPAGNYLSLQIKLGEAAGKNWWCVAFPAVCMAATADEMETAAVSAGFGQQDLRMMISEEPDVEIRYWILEALVELRRLLPARGS